MINPPFDSSVVAPSELVTTSSVFPSSSDNGLLPSQAPGSQTSQLLPSTLVELEDQSVSSGAAGRSRTPTTAANVGASARKKRRRGTAGDDRLVARGDTILRGLAGNDTLIARKKNNVLIGGGGSDVLNSRRGRGDNTLRGGGGADELIGGGRNDLLIGGGGADDFVLADRKLNKGISRVKDFKANDRLVFRGVGRVDEFSDLKFRRQGKDTLIRRGRRDLALIQNIRPNALRSRSDDFIFGEEPVIPTVPSLSVNDLTVTEGDSGSTNGTFTVALNQAATATVTVNVAIASGSATLGTDFTATNSTLTFAPGETVKTVTVGIIGDLLDEADETFSLTLSNATNATISDGIGVGLILDNEEALTSRPGNTYSQSAQNQETLESQFTTYTIDRNGLYILDQSPNNAKVGNFIGAIEDFREVEGKLKVVRDDDPGSDNDDVVTENGFAVISDEEPFVLRDTIFDIGNLEAKLVYNAPLFDNRTVIEYTFYTGTGGDRVDIRTSVLDIDDLGDSNNPTDTFNDFPTRTLPPNFDRDAAINSLQYIAENHLLGLTVPLIDPDEDGEVEPGAVDIILQDSFEEDLATGGIGTQKGNRYSKTGQNQTGITQIFDVVNVDPSDQFITDQDPDADTGLFIGAIRDLTIPTGGSLLQDQNTFKIALDSDGNPILNPNDPITNTTIVFAEGNLEAKLIEESADFDDRDVIQYTLFSGQGASRQDELTLTLDFNDSLALGFFPDISLPQPFDANLAVNDINYIIDNDLLSLTEPDDGFLADVLSLTDIDV